MRTLRRLFGLAPALLLVAGLCMSVAIGGTAHAASTITVSSCTASALDSALATAQASSGNTINFSCSGDIQLDQTLSITTTLTIDGSGQSVTLDGHGAMQVISVPGGANLTLNALTITNGKTSGFGGGILNYGTLTMSNSTVSNSTSTSNGGGGVANGGTAIISNSTLTGNSALQGGGIFNGDALTVTNSTLSNNSASGVGGAMAFNHGTATLTSDTLSNNSSSQGGGFYNYVGTVNLTGNIVAENTAPTDNDCTNSGGTITDKGYNLESGTDCGFTGTGSKQNTNPKLASALADNGGPTQTLALLDNSPAINAIPSASCPTSSDQRGVARPQGSGCDIGAFEFRTPVISVPSTITVNATSAAGAAVTYTVSASNPDDPTVAVTPSCTPSSGSTFAIGTTTVNCSASNVAGSGSASFQVVVNDVLPTLQLPSTITTNATSPAGAVVTYTVTASDPIYTASQLTISCSPASGSMFAIGTTPVNCSVKDPANNTVTGSFQVVVVGASGQISALTSLVESMGLSQNVQSVLLPTLQTAQDALAAHQTESAIMVMHSFISEVRGLTGQGISPAQANQLIAAAKQIIAVLGG